MWTWPTVFFILVAVQQRRLRSWYDLQEELAAEKEAVGSIIGVAWNNVGQDGGLIHPPILII